MSNYFISFDLLDTHNEQSRKPIADAIRETFPLRSFQFLSNGWFIQTDWLAEDVRHWLLDLIRPSWKGTVIRITDPMFGRPTDPSDLPEWLLIKNENP